MHKHDLDPCQAPLRLAMWSGPRNISTAMMRSWGNRPDTFVWDEPLYAHYLAFTGLDHPGAAETIAHYETDWRKVVAALTGAIAKGKTIFYQKHMTHHLLPHIDRSWLDKLTHCFLIRDPKEMLASLAKTLKAPTLADTGLVQQVEIFHQVRDRFGKVPPVLDAKDVLEDPRRTLQSLTDALGIEFSEAMLCWPAGGRDRDGIWGKYWYATVEQSTGFQPYQPKSDPLPDALRDLHAQCLQYYEELYSFRLNP